MKNFKNTYSVNPILGTNQERVIIIGEVNRSYNIDSYLFNQQLGTFINSNDEYRIAFLEKYGEKHIEPYIDYTKL